MCVIIPALIGRAFCCLITRSLYASKPNLHNQMHLFTGTRGELERKTHWISKSGIVQSVFSLCFSSVQYMKIHIYKTFSIL